MRKLGPIMAIGSGILAIVVGTITLLMVHGIIDPVNWVNTYNDNRGISKDISANVIYGIQIGFGVLAVMLGMAAFKKGRGFSAFLLLIIFVAITGMALYVGFKDDSWKVMTIVSVSIYSIATFGLALGLFIPKK